MLMPESSSEIISSGVTPTCWRNRTSFSAAIPRGTRLSRRNPWTGCRLAIVGVAALSREISQPLKGEFRFDCLH